jgi:glutathione S-transferase
LAGGPYLLGDRFTAADVVVGSTLRFGIAFKLLPERPEVMAYIGRLLERPAMQRTLALDEELASS